MRDAGVDADNADDAWLSRHEERRRIEERRSKERITWQREEDEARLRRRRLSAEVRPAIGDDSDEDDDGDELRIAPPVVRLMERLRDDAREETAWRVRCRSGERHAVH